MDEGNAAIGLARLYAEGDKDRLLSHIQNDLFDLGADLCIPQEKDQKKLSLQVSQVTFLEEMIDTYNKDLPSLTSFVLPGGTPQAATLHFARTVIRRGERTLCALKDIEPLNEFLIPYMNRLSDLLFVLARYANHQSGGDHLWVPGAHR